MLTVENISVAGIEPAIRGMRNPMNSWDRSDTKYSKYTGLDLEGNPILIPYSPPRVGKADLHLMHKLYKAGTEHRKFMRMIVVWMDIVAPLYWWKEAETYKIGTVCNSCSTMHKIHDKEFTIFDFSSDQLKGDALNELTKVIKVLNKSRKKFLKTNSKEDWWNMIQLLPSSYNQRRTIMMNYEVATRIIDQRSNHKLNEWHTLVKELQDLPYLKEIMKG